MSYNSNNYYVKPKVNILEQYNVNNIVTAIGHFGDTIWTNKENTMCVCSFIANNIIVNNVETVLHEKGHLKLAGNFSKGDEHSTYKITGKIGLYKSKNQFQIEKQIIVEKIEYIEPTDENNIIAFLASGLVKGVGEKTAVKIVKGCIAKNNKIIDGFGEKSLEIIKSDHMKLTKIPGITKARAQKIHDTYMKNIDYQNVIMYFTQFDIKPNKIMKIYNNYGGDSVTVVKNNPYKLSEIDGFGFLTCDDIARKIGINPHEQNRIKAGIFYTLENASVKNGHCYLTEGELLNQAYQHLSISINIDHAKSLISEKTGTSTEVKISNLTYNVNYNWLEEELKRVINERNNGDKNCKIIIDKISIEELTKVMYWLCETKELEKVSYNNQICIYLHHIYVIERRVAECINNILNAPLRKTNILKIKESIRKYELENKFNLEEKQSLSVVTSLSSNISVLTGSAGSGKTTCINCLLNVINDLYPESEFILCAPTGKAAKRMSEVSGYEAKTIHRLLESKPPNSFNYNRDNHLPYDYIICDEQSMTDLYLMKFLIDAVDCCRTQIIFIGDTQQLPSVSCGNILSDMINSNNIPTTFLNVIKRQQEGSGIVKNANKVLSGQMIETDKANKDFYVLYEKDTKLLADRMINGVKKLLEQNVPVEKIQVVCLQRNSEIGTEQMNRRIQETVNPKSDNKAEYIIKGRCKEDTIFRVGDKVIHLTNSYDMLHFYKGPGEYLPKGTKGIFNGDTGVIIDIFDYNDEESSDEIIKYIAVKFDEIIILYDKNSIDALEHAYALTAHKVQGSQYDYVIAPISFRNYSLLFRNILYTIISRAKVKAYILGDPSAIKFCINNVRLTQRNTMLKELIVYNSNKGVIAV